MKNLKAFILVSVAIHIIGALGFYFYYHPISEVSLSKKSAPTDPLTTDSSIEQEPLPTPPDIIEGPSGSLVQETTGLERSSIKQRIFSKLSQLLNRGRNFQPESPLEPDMEPGFELNSAQIAEQGIEPTAELVTEPAEPRFEPTTEPSLESGTKGKMATQMEPRFEPNSVTSPEPDIKSGIESASQPQPELTTELELAQTVTETSSNPLSPSETEILTGLANSPEEIKSEIQTEPSGESKPPADTDLPSQLQAQDLQEKPVAFKPVKLNPEINSELNPEANPEISPETSSASLQKPSELSSLQTEDLESQEQEQKLKASKPSEPVAKNPSLEKSAPESLQTALELPSSQKQEINAQEKIQNPQERQTIQPGQVFLQAKKELRVLERYDRGEEPLQAPQVKPQEITESPVKEAKASVKSSPNKEAKAPVPSSKVTALRFKKLSQVRQKPGNPSLEYPDFARRKAQQGEISVTFYINDQGLTEQIQLERSSGHAELDNFVIRHLSKHEFLDKNTWVRFRRNFILKGEEVERLKLRTLTPDEKAL